MPENMKASSPYLYTVLVIFILMALPLDLEAQCAMCKQAAETTLKSDPKSLVRSLNTGILYLMAVPYLMLMFIFRKQIVKLWKSKFGKVSETEVN